MNKKDNEFKRYYKLLKVGAIEFKDIPPHIQKRMKEWFETW